MENFYETLAIIVEDDPLNSSMLGDLIQDHFPQIRVAGSAASISEARTLLRCLQIDLLFLDMELPDGKGFDLLETLPEVNFEVIVTTSYSQYALDAIHYSALDYIIKPVSLEHLTKALERFNRKISQTHPSRTNDSPPMSLFHRLPLPTSEGIIFINTEEIIHADADGPYTVFTLIQGKKILVSRPLNDFEERLIPRNFFRIHNSHVINLSQVSKYIRGEGGYVIMSNNASIPVSRTRKKEFLNRIGY